MARTRTQQIDPHAVDTTELARIVAEFQSGALNPDDTMRKFSREFPPALAKVRRQAGMRPVPINGSLRQGLSAGYFQMRLRDGTVGYFQRRVDDCMRASIASLLQMPPYLVPDVQLDQLSLDGKEPEEVERIVVEKFRPWRAKYGVRIFSHVTPPRSSKRWIGLIGADNPLAAHTLLMSGPDCLFDPAHLLEPRGTGMPTALEGYTVADIDYGITIERT